MGVRRATIQRKWVEVFRGLGALVGVLFLLVGVPAALISWVGWPLPSEVPSVDEISQALQDTDISEGFLVKALALVCWFVWVELVASLLVEAVAYARGREAAQVPAGGGVQRAAARLIASVALLGALSASRGAPEAAELVFSPLVGNDSSPVELVSDDTGDHLLSGTGHAAPEEEAPAALQVYEVQWRDTLWAVAESHLGDPLRWPEIYDLNQGRQFDDGRVFNDPDLIHPGWLLDMPADAVGLDQPAREQERPPEQPEPGPDSGPDQEPDPPDGGGGDPDGSGADRGPSGPGGMYGTGGQGGPLGPGPMGPNGVGDGRRSGMVLMDDEPEPEPAPLQYAEGEGEMAAGVFTPPEQSDQAGSDPVAPGEPLRAGMVLLPPAGDGQGEGHTGPSEGPADPAPIGPSLPPTVPGEELAMDRRQRRRPDRDLDRGPGGPPPGPSGPVPEDRDTPVTEPPPAGGQA